MNTDKNTATQPGADRQATGNPADQPTPQTPQSADQRTMPADMQLKSPLASGLTWAAVTGVAIGAVTLGMKWLNKGISSYRNAAYITGSTAVTAGLFGLNNRMWSNRVRAIGMAAEQEIGSLQQAVAERDGQLAAIRKTAGGFRSA